MHLEAFLVRTVTMAPAVPQLYWSHWVELTYCLWSKFHLWALGEFSTILRNLFFPPRWENSDLFIFYVLPIFLTTNLKHSRSSGYFPSNEKYCRLLHSSYAICQPQRGWQLGGRQRFLLLISRTWELPWLIFRSDENFQVCREPKLYQQRLVLTLIEAVRVWSWFCLVFVFLFCVSFYLLAVEVPTLRITLLMHVTWVFDETSSFGGVLKSNSVIMPRVTIHSPEHAVLATHLLSESHGKIGEAPTYLTPVHQPLLLQDKPDGISLQSLWHTVLSREMSREWGRGL